MNKFINALKLDSPYFYEQNDIIDEEEIGEFKLTEDFKRIYPYTTELINKSHKTKFKINEVEFTLFTWQTTNGICGWKCQFDEPIIDLIDAHKTLIKNIGGIKDYFNGPESSNVNGVDYDYTLNLNQDWMFIGSKCQNEIDWQDYYIERCTMEESKPVDLSNAVFFSREANGSWYYYNRQTEIVRYITCDNGFRFAESLPNQPEEMIFSLKGINSFVDFVEVLSMQWLDYLEK